MAENEKQQKVQKKEKLREKLDESLSSNSKTSSEVRRRGRARSPDLRATEKNPFLKKMTVDISGLEKQLQRQELTP
jgi:hypothetical protein